MDLARVLFVLVAVWAQRSEGAQPVCEYVCSQVRYEMGCKIVEDSPLHCTISGCGLSLDSCKQYIAVERHPAHVDGSVCPVAVVNISVPEQSACASCKLACIPPGLRNVCQEPPDMAPPVCVKKCEPVACPAFQGDASAGTSDSDTPSTTAYQVAVILLALLLTLVAAGLIYYVFYYGLVCRTGYSRWQPSDLATLHVHMTDGCVENTS